MKCSPGVITLIVSQSRVSHYNTFVVTALIALLPYFPDDFHIKSLRFFKSNTRIYIRAGISNSHAKSSSVGYHRQIHPGKLWVHTCTTAVSSILLANSESYSRTWIVNKI